MTLNIEALQRENQTLRKQIEQREAEIQANLRLITAGEASAMIVHEVLNPITAILSRLQHLLDEESDFQLLRIILEQWEEELKEQGATRFTESLLEKIEDSSTLVLEEDMENLVKGVQVTQQSLEFLHHQLKRSILIINNLRELSRAESTISKVDVGSLFQMIEEIQRDSFKKRNISLQIKEQPSCLILVDENEIVQVLHNLTRNAMQAIGTDGTVTLSCSNTDQVEIRVSDSGSGIPQELGEKVFDKRFTTKGKHEGTGLGLTLSKRIVQKYDGDLIIEDIGGEGKGATFLCWFPKVSSN